MLLGLDAIAEANVVAAPDERLGERAAAVVRVREGMDAPTLDQVRAHFGDAGLARQKWPEALYVVDDFPRTASGKVQKFRLRQDLREGRLVPRPGDDRRMHVTARGTADPAAAAEEWPDEMRGALAALRPPEPRHPFPSRQPGRPEGAQRARHPGPVPRVGPGVPHVQRARAVRHHLVGPPARAAGAAGRHRAPVHLRVEAARGAGRRRRPRSRGDPRHRRRARRARLVGAGAGHAPVGRRAAGATPWWPTPPGRRWPPSSTCTS